jgi:predicted metal-dependent phosphoesterase TrpH
VLLGLHRVPPAGVAFELEIDLGPADPEPAAPAPPRPARPPRRELPATEGRAWLAGDLHTHTVHSDGVVTVAALACLARERGLDFLAVTDHNTTSHHAELPAAADLAGVLLVAGLELTTERGHANCLGSSRWVDFRRSADDWLVDAEAAGGLLSINHPLAGEMAWTVPRERLPPLVEVWHSSWDRLGLGPLEWWKEWGGGLPVGGSDFHRFGDDDLPGAPTTWLEVEGEDVLGALRAGRVVLSAGPRAPVAVRHEDTLLLLDADGTTLVGPEDVSRRIASDRERLPAGTGPYRLVGDDGLTLALTP